MKTLRIIDDYTAKEAESYGLSCPEKTLTQQQYADECDINNIIRQYTDTGIIKNLRDEQPQYIDVADLTDYQTSLNIVLDAQDQFFDLDAHTRDYFHNDPARLLAALNDPTQTESLIKLGLAATPKRELNVITDKAADPPINPTT